MLDSFSSDVRLVEKVVKGNKKAFEELVTRYEQKLYRFCWHTLQNREDAEDVVQQTFIKLWQNPNLFDSQKKTQFSTWLYQIAKNTCVDSLRKNNMYLLGENNDILEDISKTLADSEQNQPEQQYEQQQQSKILQQAINALNDEQRTIIILYHLQEESYQEIATIMNASQKSVEGTLYRARKKIKQFIQNASQS